MPEACESCGCRCKGRELNSCSLDLHEEIEHLSSQLREKTERQRLLDIQIQSEHQWWENEHNRLSDELTRFKEKYERLLDNQRALQKVNHDLEDGRLLLVARLDSEKTKLQHEVSSLTSRLIKARYLVQDLEDECEKYRLDCLTAVHLLQCKPSSFVAQKLQTLPLDLQERLNEIDGPHTADRKSKNAAGTADDSANRVVLPTFPPTCAFMPIERVNSMPNFLVTDNQEEEDQITTDALDTIFLRHNRKPALSASRERIFVCARCHHDVVLVEDFTQTYESSFGVLSPRQPVTFQRQRHSSLSSDSHYHQSHLTSSTTKDRGGPGLTFSPLPTSTSEVISLSPSAAAYATGCSRPVAPSPPLGSSPPEQFSMMHTLNSSSPPPPSAAAQNVSSNHHLSFMEQHVHRPATVHSCVSRNY